MFLKVPCSVFFLRSHLNACTGSWENMESFPPAQVLQQQLGTVLGSWRLEPPCRGISFLAQGACCWPSSAGRGGKRSTSARSAPEKLKHLSCKEDRGAGRECRTAPLKDISRLCWSFVLLLSSALPDVLENQIVLVPLSEAVSARWVLQPERGQQIFTEILWKRISLQAFGDLISTGTAFKSLVHVDPHGTPRVLLWQTQSQGLGVQQLLLWEQRVLGAFPGQTHSLFFPYSSYIAKGSG